MSKNKKGKVVSLKQEFSPERYIKTQARSLPIVECLISEGWEGAGISNIMVARQHKTGNYTAGVFLVDMYCLGVKDAHYEFNMDRDEYEFLKENCGEVEHCDYVLAHNVIYGAVAYAEDYGFKPHPEFAVAQYILEEDTDDVPLMEIEFGYEDKPLYVQGPYDDEAKIKSITALLKRTAGEGNFIIEASGDGFDDVGHEDFDDGDFDDDSFGDDSFEDELDDETEGFGADIEEKNLHQTLLKRINRGYDIAIRGRDPKSPAATSDIGTAYKVTEGHVKNEYTTFDNDAQQAEYNRLVDIFMDGEYDKGLKLAKRAVEKYSGSVAFHDMLLSAYNATDDFVKAKKSVQEIYRLFPGVLMARVSYANVLLTEGKPAEGLALFEGKKDLNEFYPHRKLFHIKEAAEYYACMSRLYVTLGDFDHADLYMNAIFSKNLLKRAPNSFVSAAIREMLSAKFKILGDNGPYNESVRKG